VYAYPGMTEDGRLAVNSPCIDAGIRVPWLIKDRFGVARPQDGDGDGVAAYDIGAHEFVPSDADRDGIPDVYELANDLNQDADDAADDWDGDGSSNYLEYLAGTRANDRASFLHIVDWRAIGTGNVFALSWSSVSNRVYCVDLATNLTETDYTELEGSLPATPPENCYTSSPPMDTPQRFYRVRVKTVR